MRNGSTRNERSRNTARITGKNERPYSTHHGIFSGGVPAARAVAHQPDFVDRPDERR